MTFYSSFGYNPFSYNSSGYGSSGYGSYSYGYSDPTPQIISDGGGNSAYLHTKENTRFVTDVATKDNLSSESNGRLSYSIVGGADKSFFSIDYRSGKVYFNDAPDFENPLDYGRNNQYEVKVQVKDGAGYTDTQLLKVNVKDVADINPRPQIVSDGGGDLAHVNVSENSKFVTDVQTTDNISTEANGRLSYFIHGGEDQAFFNIDQRTGKVYFDAAPDFEKPADRDGNNTYEVGVKVIDGAGYTDTQLLKVKVQDIAEGTPPTHGPDDPGSPTPNPGEGSIVGDDGDNFLQGTGADEMISGGGGNDVLLGGGGNDRLNATDSSRRGVGEVDNLSGQAGRDVFLLGDSNGSYYLGGGFSDFAILNDFNAGEDRIVLSGNSSEYSVSNSGDGSAFIIANSGNDAVANVLNTSATELQLNSSDFVYV